MSNIQAKAHSDTSQLVLPDQEIFFPDVNAKKFGMGHTAVTLLSLLNTIVINTIL